MDRKNLSHAADAIRAAIKQYRALDEYADAIEKLGSIDNAVAETQSRLNALKDEETLAKASLADVKAKVAEAKGKLEDEIKQRTAAAVDEINAAKAEAKQARAKAKDVAEEIIAKAQAQAHDIITAAQATTVEAANRKEQLTAEVYQLEAARVLAKQDLDALQGQLATIKAKIGSLLG